MCCGRKRDEYESIPSADEVELTEVKATEADKPKRSKPKSYWEDLWDEASGNDLEKSIALLRKYSGYRLGLFGRVVTGRWHTTYGELVDQVLDVMDGMPRSTSIKSLFFQINQRLDHLPDEKGDFRKITTLIREKTTKPQELMRDFGIPKRWV